jgi:hypothetical protein
LGFGELRGITAGPDGNLWFTIDNSGADAIGRITPDGSFTQFAVPPGPGNHSLVFTNQITAGADGNLWFTAGDLIGRVTTDGTVTLIFGPDASFTPPGGITAGSDGNLWLTEPVSIGQFVLGDGAGAGGAAAAAPPAGLAQAVGRLGSDHPAQAAAVDALFAGARPGAVSRGGVGQRPAVAAVDAAFSVSRPEGLTPPQQQHAAADAGRVPHHPVVQAAAADVAGLADPLAAGLAQVL